MNGVKRASRRQAAVVGLSVLMGTLLLGCHAGPRFLSKNDRERRANKNELAGKDKGKFIDRKKIRSESDYLNDTGEQVAKKESKAKPRPTDPIRKSDADANERVVAARQQPDAELDTTTRSAKSKTAGNQSKTTTATDHPEIARRNATKRPVTDLLNDGSGFEQDLPDSRATAKRATTSKSAAEATASKTSSMDEDPFKDSIIGPKSTRQTEERVETVNFFYDNDETDEIAEEADDLENLHAPAAKNNVAKSAVSAALPTRQVSPSQRKFLDETDEPAAGSFGNPLRDEVTEDTNDKEIASADLQSVKRADAAPNIVAGQKVIDRRQQVQQTLDDWRRDMDSDDESSVSLRDDVEAAAPPTSVRTNHSPAARRLLSQTDVEEFVQPPKSQGAVLNGDLIIDTNNLPSKLQRSTLRPIESSPPSGASGRMNSNSGANIDITPGTTQTRPRSTGRISLQSATDLDIGTSLTTADYDQTPDSSDLDKLPSLKSDADPETDPTLDDEADIAPSPPEELTDSNAGIGLSNSSTRHRAWKRTLIVLAAMASAVLIGFGLRRRMELIPESIRLPKQPRLNPQDPASWPRG